MEKKFGSRLIPYVVKGLETDYLNQCRKELVKEVCREHYASIAKKVAGSSKRDWEY